MAWFQIRKAPLKIPIINYFRESDLISGTFANPRVGTQLMPSLDCVLLVNFRSDFLPVAVIENFHVPCQRSNHLFFSMASILVWCCLRFGRAAFTPCEGLLTIAILSKRPACSRAIDLPRSSWEATNWVSSATNFYRSYLRSHHSLATFRRYHSKLGSRHS